MNNERTKEKLTQSEIVTCYSDDYQNELLLAKKIYKVIELLGGQSDILSTIGSWRIDANDQQTFELIDAWIEETIQQRKK